MTLPILSVSELTQAIKQNLEGAFPLICLQGEISNFKQQTSGHLYFSLKDANAQISVVMFRGQATQLKLLPKSGDQVIVKGEITVYPTKGNYQLIIRELSYVGLGELLLKLEQLKIKLHQLGWFKTARKKPLPKLPKRIGVVTSPTGAVIQDILHVLTRRFSGFHLILNPVKVQGEGAAQEIAKAIEEFNKYDLVDVMIVGRGGGSLEDLWAFNEEIVAAAIYNSHIPIICAVGHETDHCIAEYVADVRAPTPSAAAEMVMAEKAQQLNSLDIIRRRMQQTMRHLVSKDRHRLEGISKHPFLTAPKVMLEARMQRLDDSRDDLDLSIGQLLQHRKKQIAALSRQLLAMKPTTKIQHIRQKLLYLTKAFDDRIRHRFENKYKKLEHLSFTLKAIDPRNLLNKGYSILFAEKERRVIHSIHQLKKQQKARIWLADGEAVVTINDLIPNEQEPLPTRTLSSEL